MKKLFIIAAALPLLLLASCNKEKAKFCYTGPKKTFIL